MTELLVFQNLRLKKTFCRIHCGRKFKNFMAMVMKYLHLLPDMMELC